MNDPYQTAGEVARQVRSGHTSARDVVTAALERARGAAHLNAFITLDEAGALAAARAVDESVAAGRDPGPLAGVPVAVKDNIVTGGLRTTAASRSLEEFVPPFDATVVARLRAAGAIVLGKTNMDEFGMGSTGENSAFGPVRNPADPGRVAGGSSGGSAAAVAAGVVPLALGTDTGGSVRQPAAFCGVVGIKPTYGALSRYGVIAFASSLDQVGVFSRDAEGAALALQVMAGADERDATTLPAPPDFGTTGSVAGLRVGIVGAFAGEGVSTPTRAGLALAQEKLLAGGASVELLDLETIRHAVATYYLVATAEASSNLARFDGTIYGRREADAAAAQAQAITRTRAATLGKEVKRRILMGTYALSAGFVDEFHGQALRVRRLIARELERAFGAFDLLLTPTTPAVAFELGEAAEDPLAMYLADSTTCLANLAGLPAVSVPVPVPAGSLPVGVQLMAPAREDARLLAAARFLLESEGTAA